MLKVLVASDKWKESLTAAEVAGVVGAELCAMFGAERVAVASVPLSDGGEGFLSALTGPLRLEHVRVAHVTGPLEACGSVDDAEYGANAAAGVAVVEMARASGLALVPPALRNPLRTSTRGTGELLLHAHSRGFRRILLGVGGSATNDAGVGALVALGMRVKLEDGTSPATVTGEMLSRIASISVPPEGLLPGCRIEVSCDVQTPLVGPAGATALFAAQKGATTAEDRAMLEKGMLHVSSKLFPHDVQHLPGAGAAGGLPGGLAGVLGPDRVVFRSGFDIVSEAHSLERAIASSHLVVTGEGAFDGTTAKGKVVARVLDLCDRNRVPVVVLCGQHKDSAGSGRHVHALLDMFDLNQALTNPAACLRSLVRATARTWPVLSSTSPCL